MNKEREYKLPDFRSLRKGSGLTLRKVEELTGISNAYLSQLETGKVSNPSWFTVTKLLDLYGSYYSKEGDSFEEAPLKPDPECQICRGKGTYTFGGSFGGYTQTVTCGCWINNKK